MNSKLLIPALLMAWQTYGQVSTNYDEAKVAAYTLPDPLVFQNGQRVRSAEEWTSKQRPHIYELFENHVYGRMPIKKLPVSYEATILDTAAYGGLGVMKSVRVVFGKASMSLLLVVPRNVKEAPVFLGLRFTPEVGERWQVEKILQRGYALATIYYEEIEPDQPDGWKTGLRSTLQSDLEIQPQEWGAIGVWAWSLSRAMDYLETEPAVDASRVALIGHSRLGKTALWAGAGDTRFALVISNESGEGGAALARRWYGETVKDLNSRFPHWFCSGYSHFNDDVTKLPVDQHELLSLIAPRPVYVASAQEDQWSDPRGEFLSAKNAEPVYALFGRGGLGTATMPEVNQPVGDFIRYHIRDGKHNVTGYDWDQYLDFADAHLGK